MDFLGTLGGGVWSAVFFVIALSIIVAIHEYGHYIVGRWSGIHAEVFSLGFGPVLASRTDRRGTKWQIAAIPFGGYVSFSAMPMPPRSPTNCARASRPRRSGTRWRARRSGRGC
jgi:RIP metalloprotease RseP